MKFLLVAFSAFITICFGDPETVEGLIQNKRLTLDPKKNLPLEQETRVHSATIPLFRHGYLREQIPFDRIWKAITSSPSSTMKRTTRARKSTVPNRTTTPTPPSSISSSSVFEDINEVSSFVTSSGSNIKRQEPSVSNVNEVSPQLSALSQKKSDVSFEEEDNKNGIATLIIGIAFVAVFVGIAVSLVALQSSIFHEGSSSFILGGPRRKSEEGENGRRKDIFDPDDEDQTPPELRGLGSQPPSFVQPNVTNKDNNEQSPPFFFGKLMLNDSPTESQEGHYSLKTSKFVSHTMNSMTSMLLAAQEAISSSRSPSPTTRGGGEKIEDLLVIDPCKSFGGSEDDAEVSEDESDDTVYECRGLASPGEMEVRNPFYLQGQEDTFNLETTQNPEVLAPKTISQVPLLHQGIKGYN